MSPLRIIFLAASSLILLGCSESPESTIDEIADRSKGLVQDSREWAEGASADVIDQLEEAKAAATTKIIQSSENLQEQ